MNPTAPSQTAQQPASQPSIVITPDTPNGSSPKPKMKLSKTLLGVLAVAVIAIAIPVTLFVISQRQTITQQAAPPEKPANAVAQVYGAYVLSPEVDTFVKDSGKERTDALNILIERKILDEESKRSGIGVTDPEITAEMQRVGIEDFEKMRVFTKYDLLKEKILKANVQYIEAQVISFWLPPLDYPVEVPAAKKQEVATQRSQLKDLLTTAEGKLTAKEDPVDVAKELITKYPAFEHVLVLNGSNVSASPDETLREPYIHIIKAGAQKTVLGVLLEGMNEGEVKQLEQVDGSGGMIALVTSKHTGTFDSYDTWLADKKTKFVKLF